MSSILPKERLAPTRINPKRLLIYGPPKIGKTTIASELDNCLVLDAEQGAEALSVMRIPITSIHGAPLFDDKGKLVSTGLKSVVDEIMAEGIAEFNKTGKKPKPPYKYIVVDTIDKIEDFCEVSATAAYKKTTIGKNFDGKSVLELPQGGGYYYLRNEVLYWLDQLSAICEYLIVISHIKEKLLNKGGIDVAIRDIALTGKLGAIVCAKMDAIGYAYRETGTGPLMVSFESFDNGSVMGARFTRLAGKKIPFKWEDIYLPDEVQG